MDGGMDGASNLKVCLCLCLSLSLSLSRARSLSLGMGGESELLVSPYSLNPSSAQVLFRLVLTSI